MHVALKQDAKPHDKAYCTLLPKMRVQCRMSNMQPKAPIIWCRATVRAHAATLHHNSIQHTHNPELCTNQIWTIQGQNKLSWDEPNKSVIYLEYVANILMGKKLL